MVNIGLGIVATPIIWVLVVNFFKSIGDSIDGNPYGGRLQIDQLEV